MLSRVITLAALTLGGLAVHPVAGAALIPDYQEKASLKDNEKIVALEEEVIALKAKNVALEAAKTLHSVKKADTDCFEASNTYDGYFQRASPPEGCTEDVQYPGWYTGDCSTKVPSSTDPSSAKPAKDAQAKSEVRAAAELRWHHHTFAPARTVAIALLAMTTSCGLVSRLHARIPSATTPRGAGRTPLSPLRALSHTQLQPRCAR